MSAWRLGTDGCCPVPGPAPWRCRERLKRTTPNTVPCSCGTPGTGLQAPRWCSLFSVVGCFCRRFLRECLVCLGAPRQRQRRGVRCGQPGGGGVRGPAEGAACLLGLLACSALRPAIPPCCRGFTAAPRPRPATLTLSSPLPSGPCPGLAPSLCVGPYSPLSSPPPIEDHPAGPGPQ